MLTKQAVALLALGAEVHAYRCYPHPYHYIVTSPSDLDIEITADDIVSLLGDGMIAAPPVGEWGDSYSYRIASLTEIQARALRDYRFGFGRCAHCGLAPVGGTAQGGAARHGHTKHDPTPCAGSGKPLASFVPAPNAELRAVA